VCAALVERLGRDIPTLRITGTASPMFDPSGDDTEFLATLDRASESCPDVMLFALGSPKQEYALVRYVDRFRPAVAMGVGATFDFLVGRQRRSPQWMSRYGLEWLYRLAQNPRRLWRRYLVDDRVFALIAWRAWRARHATMPRPG
jgi:N-acetylglucosaminyldiphosphoundecaprenol N-acetyl-beta-D-mannosaminyltransferase